MHEEGKGGGESPRETVLNLNRPHPFPLDNSASGSKYNRYLSKIQNNFLKPINISYLVV